MSFLFNLIPAPYRFAAIAALVIGLWLHGYWTGHAGASGACQTAALEAKVKSLTRDLTATDEAAKRFEAEAARNAVSADANAKIIEGFRNAKSPACLLTDDDARRLRAIR